MKTSKMVLQKFISQSYAVLAELTAVANVSKHFKVLHVCKVFHLIHLAAVAIILFYFFKAEEI